MKYTPIIAFLSFLFLFPLQSEGQRKRFNPKQRFHAGMIVGLNAAQMDGDNFSGYDKLGVLGGLQGIALINRRVSLVTELLYSQKGTRIEYLDRPHPRKERVLGLNYAEVPFLIRIDLLPNEEDNKNPIQLETGFSFARLVHTKIEENVSRVRYSFTEVSDDFVKSDVNFIVGLQVGLFSGFNLGVRSTTGINKSYVNEDVQPLTHLDAMLGVRKPYAFFRNYHLSFYASYQIY